MNQPATIPPGHEHVNIQIDRVHYRVEAHQLTGEELRNLVSPPIPDSRDLFLVIPGGTDEKIERGQVVILHNGMRFFTAPAQINPGSRG